MRVAGHFSAGGIKLVPIAKTHREAWEAGLTEEDNTALRRSLPIRIGDAGEVVLEKLNAAFSHPEEE